MRQDGDPLCLMALGLALTPCSKWKLLQPHHKAAREQSLQMVCVHLMQHAVANEHALAYCEPNVLFLKCFARRLHVMQHALADYKHNILLVWAACMCPCACIQWHVL